MNKAIENLIRMALAEDIGSGDLTTKLITSNAQSPTSKQIPTAKAQIIAKENGVVAGLPLAQLVYQVLDKKVKFKSKVKDGHRVKKGKVIAQISGPAASILTGERLALNFLQRMSGIATLTRKFKDQISKIKNKVDILDTRKTIPLWRGADKYAVLAGGGYNHRFGLYDGILIKDNHITIVGGIEKALEGLRALPAGRQGQKMAVEVETKNIAEVKKAIKAGVDKILLDNMSLKTLRKAVKLCKKAKVWCEASGGVNLKTVRKIAKTGVDAISVGALTHSVKALDVSLEVIKR